MLQCVYHTIENSEKKALEDYKEVVKGAQLVIDKSRGKRNQLVHDPVKLLKQALATKAKYAKTIKDVIQLMKEDGVIFDEDIKFSAAPVDKSMLKAKIPGHAERTCDLVRGMAICKDMSVIHKFVNYLTKAHTGFTTKSGAVIKPMIERVRLKDRFNKPSDSGWRDFMDNFICLAAPGQTDYQHICELQIVHHLMIVARKIEKAAAEKAAKAALVAAKKEQDDIAAAKADGAFIFNRFSGEVGVSPINRTGSVYNIQFNAFDSFVSEEVPAAGKRYYETECVSVGQGIAQVGFADEKFSAGRGSGVGDDKHSWGFDGNRVCKWGNATQAKYGKAWSDGDVLGCAIDFDAKQVSFYLNGETMGIAFDGIEFTGKLRVAASAQGNSYKLKFNFGTTLAFPAPAGYTTFK